MTKTIFSISFPLFNFGSPYFNFQHIYSLDSFHDFRANLVFPWKYRQKMPNNLWTQTHGATVELKQMKRISVELTKNYASSMIGILSSVHVPPWVLALEELLAVEYLRRPNSLAESPHPLIQHGPTTYNTQRAAFKEPTFVNGRIKTNSCKL